MSWGATWSTSLAIPRQPSRRSWQRPPSLARTVFGLSATWHRRSGSNVSAGASCSTHPISPACEARARTLRTRDREGTGSFRLGGNPNRRSADKISPREYDPRFTARDRLSPARSRSQPGDQPFFSRRCGKSRTVAKKGGFRCRCLPRLAETGLRRYDRWNCGDELGMSPTSLSIWPRTSVVIPTERLKRWVRWPIGARVTLSC